MTEMSTYTGGCHCGNVRFEVKATFDKALSCNCSICGKTGWLLGSAMASQFTILKGEDALSDYQFGKKSVHHLFCSTCGVRSFGRGKGKDGEEWVAVNLRCLDDFNAEALPVTQFDGKSL